MADLRAERVEVQSQGSALSEALADATTPPAGLYVHALGSLHAELDGTPVRRWGGQKAGSRQAEAIFAFLLDRGDQGASKDEIVELVWPDVELDRADVAFHRTMLGLRSVLKPGLRARAADGPIAFRHDRYRLDPAVVAWSDVEEFDALLIQSGAGAPDAALGFLERARALYRGDYLDDCPYYGDSVHVEERRIDFADAISTSWLSSESATSSEVIGRPPQTSCDRPRPWLDDEIPRVTEALGRLSGNPPAIGNEGAGSAFRPEAPTSKGDGSRPFTLADGGGGRWSTCVAFTKPSQS